MPLLQRLAALFTAPVAEPAIVLLYQACVKQARSEEFYRVLDVPDTVDGRFDLIVLHVYLAMRRLGANMDVKQQLFDLMFADMDQSLREMGVGDMSIGKRIKPMIGAFYGRTQAYENALAEKDGALVNALARNLYGKITPSPEVLQKMADYVRRAVVMLDQQDVADIANGNVKFSNPVL